MIELLAGTIGIIMGLVMLVITCLGPLLIIGLVVMCVLGAINAMVIGR